MTRTSTKGKTILQETLKKQEIVIGNRIPKDFFITKGTGESDITVHAGSLHLAMIAAGIECYNIVAYTSILPSIAQEIPKPKNYVHGSVAETIWAVATATKGKRATASIIFGWLFHKKTGKKYGGLVCEYNGNLSIKGAEKQLHASLNELYTNGFDQDYDLKDITVNSESIITKKKYGTALVALCFTSHVIPVHS